MAALNQLRGEYLYHKNQQLLQTTAPHSQTAHYQLNICQYFTGNKGPSQHIAAVIIDYYVLRILHVYHI